MPSITFSKSAADVEDVAGLSGSGFHEAGLVVANKLANPSNPNFCNPLDIGANSGGNCKTYLGGII